jgi:hypothetical protein
MKGPADFRRAFFMRAIDHESLTLGRDAGDETILHPTKPFCGFDAKILKPLRRSPRVQRSATPAHGSGAFRGHEMAFARLSLSDGCKAVFPVETSVATQVSYKPVTAKVGRPVSLTPARVK